MLTAYRTRAEPRQPIAVGRKLALIVGVGEGMFNGVAQNPLPVCRFDAAAVRRVLTDLGFECTTLIDHPQTPPVDPSSSNPAPQGYPDVDNVHDELLRIVAQVVELPGCPTASLVNTDGSGDGSLRYLDVPRLTQLLVIHITEGRARTTEIRLLEE
ncbi:MAG: hypothetical protein DYG94_11445 [Leptolyngbya sp. PLA3]|nr:MAG: hypothetical protein EDM82_10590 [Cyanobacteria bacterium CYA]MCE7969341.1 hypothetical protein [Leptolyngbya sp. PL-A3]